MSIYFLWGGIGILLLFLLAGLSTGFVRGLKRSSLHILFFLGSIVLAFFITKPVTNGILNSTITVDGADMSISQWIVNLITTNFDISQFETAGEFLQRLPNAIVSPILFLALTLICFIVFDIIYLIVSRISFGSKKKDFEKSKPYRAYGALVGIVEGFMFLFVMFAPITALTKTYQEIVEIPTSQTQVLSENQQTQNKMKPVGEMLSGILPPQVNEAIFAYNKSVVGKIAGAGGLDNAVFDYLSNFNLNGQKIELRKELINFADVYNEFTVVYNDYVDNNFENIDLKNLKSNIELFLNNGIFKTVVADTINDFVVKFEDVKTSLNLQNLPVVVEDIVKEIQTVFSAEGFDTSAYLKNDIMKTLEVADVVVKSNLIDQYKNLQDKSFVGVLELIDSNNEVVSTISKNTLNINLVKDSFTTIGNFASQKLNDILKNDKGLEIALNTSIENKDKMIDDLLGAVDEFLQLNKIVSLPDLLNSTDIISTISNIENLDEALTKVGTTFDSLRNLEILNLPQTETRPQNVFVFDNLLKLYNLDLLNDEVFVSPQDTEKTKLDTYTKFFNFIKNPINEAKNLGLLEIGKEGVAFDTILDSVANKLETNENLLSEILMPFYQLSAMDLKTLVFDNVVEQLSSNISLLDFTELKAENSYQAWSKELTIIGQTIKSLNKGEIVSGELKQTYLKYLISSNADLNIVLKEILKDGNLASVLDHVFESKTFKNLTSQIFENIDKEIGELTGIVPNTILDNLKQTKAETISTIERLLEITLNMDANNINLSKIGKILDVLKSNAYNNGAKDGVFNEIFANIIWYLTGDDITGTDKFAGQTPNTNAGDIKAYLKVPNDDNFVGYYEIASYESMMAELDDVIDFTKTLNNNISGIVLSNETISDFVNGVKISLDSLDTKTDEQKVTILENMKTLIDSTGKEILSTEDKTTYGEVLRIAIDTEYQNNENMAVALKNLLGL